MKKLLIILTLGLMFGQTKLETRLYETYISLTDGDRETINIMKAKAKIYKSK